MKKWIEQIKAKIKSQEFDYKQMFLGIVIFIVAIIFLTQAFHSEEKNVSQTENALSKVITNKLNKETLSSRVSNIIPEDNSINNNPIEKVEENVILNFESTTNRDMEYKIYYTTENKASFDEKNVVLHKGQKGENKYSISLPVKKIARFRIQLEPRAGNVTIKDIYLTGSQQANLNEFEQYEFSQMDNIKIEDKSINFWARSSEASLTYYPSLIPEEETEKAEEKEATVSETKE